MLETDLFPGGIRSHNSNCLVFIDIGRVEITIASTSLSSITNNDLHTINTHAEKLEEERPKITHRNQCRVCYRHGKCMLYSFLL